MATGVEILSYKADPNLGLGSTNAIPVTPDPNLLNVVNETGRNIMFLDADRNQKIFQQKVKDRDDLLKLIDDNQVQAGKILPQFRGDFDAAQKEAQESFNAIKGINDMKGREEYNKKVAHLKDVATWGQHKTLMAEAELKELAADTLPSRQAARKKNLESNLKAGFWDEYTPYQQMLSGDLTGLMDYAKNGALVSNSGIPQVQTATTNITTQKTTQGKPTTVTTKQIVKPIKGNVSGGNISRGTSPIVSQGGAISPLQTVAGKYYDYDKILNNVQKGYLSTDEVQRHNMDWFREQIETGDPKSAMNMIDYANKRIAQYNQERGLSNTDKGFVTLIQPGQDVIVAPNGRVHLNLSTPEFTAKMALAGIEGNYVEKDKQVFDEKIDQSNLNWAKLKEDKRQANLVNNREWEKIRKSTVAKGKTQNEILEEMGNAFDSFGNFGLGGEKHQFDKETGEVQNKDGTPLTGEIRIARLDVPDGIKNLIKEGNPNYTFSEAATISVENGVVKRIQFDDESPVDRGTILNYQINQISKFIEKGNPFLPHYGANAAQKNSARQKESSPDYYKEETNVESMKGNKVTYKDGTVWEVSGNKMKKIK